MESSLPGDRRYTETYSDDELLLIKQGFAVRLREAFGGATNAEIARRIKATDATVKYYVDGSRLPTFENLLQISRVTGVNLHWLMTGRGPRAVDPYTPIFEPEIEARIRARAAERGHTFEEEIRWIVLLALDFKKKV